MEKRVKEVKKMLDEVLKVYNTTKDSYIRKILYDGMCTIAGHIGRFTERASMVKEKGI